MFMPSGGFKTTYHFRMWFTYRLKRDVRPLKIPAGKVDRAFSARYLEKKLVAIRCWILQSRIEVYLV